MTSRCVLHVALLLCCSTSAVSIDYNLLQHQQSSSSLACMDLLKQLKGRPEFCLKDRKEFKVPEAIKQPQQLQKKDAASLIYEMLQNIFDIFRSDLSNTGWNKTTVMRLFAELHLQMDCLKTVLDENPEEQNLTQGNMTILHLKNYYQRIRRYLKNKKYSSCAWTVVRVEISKNFSFINGLTGYLKN